MGENFEIGLAPKPKLYKKELKLKRDTFPNLDKAVKERFIVRGFRSGGGLRVVRVEEKRGAFFVEGVKAYGEHPEVLTALSYADESLKTEVMDYEKFYGKVVPNYLTGQSNAVSKLDKILLQGNSFKCYQRYSKTFFEIHGYDILDIRGENKLLFSLKESMSFTEILKKFEEVYEFRK